MTISPKAKCGERFYLTINMNYAYALILCGFIIAGCTTEAEWEAYNHQQCLYDRVTQEKIEPDSAGYKLCRELIESGLYDFDYELYGHDSFSQFAH